MNTDKLFTRAVSALPQTLRKRLDGGAPLDWPVLESPRTGARLAEAGRAHARLPEAVEVLANRLVHEVGIAPPELANARERRGDPAAWTRRAAIEAEGESYRIRQDPGSAVLDGVRPEAVAGYAILALELAAAAHEAAERWIEAGERHGTAPGGASSLLGLCAVRMLEHLRSRPGAPGDGRTTADLAELLGRAWNTQDLKTRAALSAVRLRGLNGMRAPGRSYYAPMTGYRLCPFEPGALLWLRALAEQAAEAEIAESREDERPRPSAPAVLPPQVVPPQVVPPSVVPPAASRLKPGSAESGASDISALEARIRAASEESGRPLALGSPADELASGRELQGLMDAAGRLPDGVRRRLREGFGIGFAHALSRLRSADEAKAVRAELEAALARQGIPRWLEELAVALLADTGALTREGARTGAIRLHPAEEEAGYRAVEAETGAAGRLAALGLVEQVRLGLAFATDAWRGHAAIRNAGREGGWVLDKGESEGSAFSTEERGALEAARRMEQVLDRIQRTRGAEAPTALEEASLTAETFRGIGAATRTAAGWPGSAEAPDPRIAGDVARIAAVSEALHERIRSIANRHIASWIAGGEEAGLGSNGGSALPGRAEARPGPA